MDDLDASANADRATAAEPVVSALRDGIPSAIADLRQIANGLRKQAESIAAAERDDWEPWGIEKKLDALLWLCNRQTEAIFHGLNVVAKAIEAGTAKTERLGPTDESAVGNADLPNNSGV